MMDRAWEYQSAIYRGLDAAALLIGWFVVALVLTMIFLLPAAHAGRWMWNYVVWAWRMMRR